MDVSNSIIAGKPAPVFSKGRDGKAGAAPLYNPSRFN